MKSSTFILQVSLFVFCVILLPSCKSDDDNNTPSNSFTDARDGNVYQTVTIGDQVWMAENLRFLPDVVGLVAVSSTIPYYYVYGYNGTDVSAAKATANYNTYGVLYNWPAAMGGSISSASNPSGVSGVCPAGWHLPSDAEWIELVNFLGDVNLAGGKLKSQTLWVNPNTGASNESGFSGFPGGFKSLGGPFLNLGQNGYWWSSTEGGENFSWYRSLEYDSPAAPRLTINKGSGFCMRCVKD
ncbi:FISUMP domain-containing protein [Paucihalobacter sp.]|uniref:FISUMP domain-containing protein n=1 Tax=Paucihalobacter sp. TaxID=2850405 RepID=UPI002FE0AFED